MKKDNAHTCIGKKNLERKKSERIKPGLKNFTLCTSRLVIKK